MPVLSLELPVTDLGGWPAAQREAELQRIANDEAQRPFDLVAGPLLRAGVIRMGSDDYVLLIVMHHIISDGWSMGVFAHEMSLLYAGISHRLKLPLPELPVRIADFARWERDCIQAGCWDEQIDYWRQQLAGMPVLHLTADGARPQSRSFRGSNFVQPLPWSSAALRELARREGCSPFALLSAAFKVILFASTGRDDLGVGTPTANRLRQETNGLIGFFLNHLVLRSRIAGDQSLRDVIRREHATCVEAYSHQDVPFEHLVDVLQPAAGLSLADKLPFWVTFEMPDTSPQANDVLQMKLDSVETDTQVALWELSAHMIEHKGKFSAIFQYATDVLDSTRVQQLARQFVMVLEQMNAAPGRVLSDLLSELSAD